MYLKNKIATYCVFALFGSLILLAFQGNTGLPQAENTELPLAELGHFLFFDEQLSKNGTKSCSSCHAPELAFTDGYRRSLGAEADIQQHNAPSLLNIAAYTTFHWSDTTVKTIEQQLLQPLFSSHRVELGLVQTDTAFLRHFRNNLRYKALFANAFPTENSQNHALNYAHIIAALAAYVRTLHSENAKYDLYRRNEEGRNEGVNKQFAVYDAALKPRFDSLTTEERAGETLFFKKLNCGSCHPYPTFTLASSTSAAFANIGLYAKYPKSDEGLAEKTKKRRDKGVFRIPSLRNIALTAPYMHDGSVRDLGEVIDIFAAGGRTIPYGDFNGNGCKNKQKSKKILGFRLSPTDKHALLAFLNTLTDTTYLQNPHFLNPF
jgi:cytochrome c peroxidase